LIPQKLNVLRRPSELSLGQDPDLIARYLSGEDVTEQLAAIEHGELPVQRGDKKSTTQDKVAVRAVPERRLAPQEPVTPPAPRPPSLKLDKLGIDQHESAQVEQPPSLPPEKGHRNGLRWSLISVGIALGAMLAISLWIAFQ